MAGRRPYSMQTGSIHRAMHIAFKILILAAASAARMGASFSDNQQLGRVSLTHYFSANSGLHLRGGSDEEVHKRPRRSHSPFGTSRNATKDSELRLQRFTEDQRSRRRFRSRCPQPPP